MSAPAVDRFNVTLAVREHSAEEAAEFEAQAGHERFVRKYAHMKAEVTA